jgi:hypothetical protein
MISAPFSSRSSQSIGEDISASSPLTSAWLATLQPIISGEIGRFVICLGDLNQLMETGAVILRFGPDELDIIFSLRWDYPLALRMVVRRKNKPDPYQSWGMFDVRCFFIDRSKVAFAATDWAYSKPALLIGEFKYTLIPRVVANSGSGSANPTEDLYYRWFNSNRSPDLGRIPLTDNVAFGGYYYTAAGSIGPIGVFGADGLGVNDPLVPHQIFRTPWNESVGSTYLDTIATMPVVVDLNNAINNTPIVSSGLALNFPFYMVDGDLDLLFFGDAEICARTIINSDWALQFNGVIARTVVAGEAVGADPFYFTGRGL